MRTAIELSQVIISQSDVNKADGVAAAIKE